MPLDETTRSLLDALEAMQRLETLAQRLRDRAANGPPLSAMESADAEREWSIVRENTNALTGQLALLRQDLRPM